MAGAFDGGKRSLGALGRIGVSHSTTSVIAVLPDWQLEPVELHVITDTRHLPARTKLFISFLKARLGEAGIGWHADGRGA